MFVNLKEYELDLMIGVIPILQGYKNIQKIFNSFLHPFFWQELPALGQSRYLSGLVVDKANSKWPTANSAERQPSHS